jgi:hypothetical protein
VYKLFNRLAFGDVSKWLFIVFVIFYIGLLMISPHLNPIDDYQTLFTLQAGKLITPFIDAGLGRFTPLLGAEYSLITRILPAVPATYFLVNSLQFGIFAIVFSKICTIATKSKSAVCIALLGFFTSQSVMTAWLRLFVGERSVAFWFAVCILAYLSYIVKPKISTFIIALISGAIAIFYKEPAFVALFTFAFLHLISSWKTTKISVKLLDISLICSSAVYALAYFFIIYLNRGPTNYATGFGYQGLHSVFREFFISDPFLLLLLIAIALWRIYKLLIQKVWFDSVYDSMLVAAIAYIGVYFKLGFYGPYYLLPAYVFAIPAILHFVFPEDFSRTQTRWRSLFIGAVAVFIYINAFSYPVYSSIFPWSLQTINRFKYVAANYDRTLDFLVADIKSRKSDSPPNIYLNLGPNSGYEAYFSLYTFLNYYKGLKSEFYVKSDILETNDSYGTTPPDLTVFKYLKSRPPSKMQKGDYFIILPSALYGNDQENHMRMSIDNNAPLPKCLNDLNPDYQLIFHTDNDLQSIFKQSKSNTESQSEILCIGSPNYYVFRIK